jgi:hypothetical protein
MKRRKRDMMDLSEEEELKGELKRLLNQPEEDLLWGWEAEFLDFVMCVLDVGEGDAKLIATKLIAQENP